MKQQQQKLNNDKEELFFILEHTQFMVIANVIKLSYYTECDFLNWS